MGKFTKQRIDDFMGYAFDIHEDYRKCFNKGISFASWLNGKTKEISGKYYGDSAENTSAILEAEKNQEIANYKIKNGEVLNDDPFEIDETGFSEKIKTPKYYDGEIKEYHSAQQEINERFKNSYLSLYVVAKTKVNERGGFFKSLFTGNIVRYFKDRSALNQLRDEIVFNKVASEEALDELDVAIKNNGNNAVDEVNLGVKYASIQQRVKNDKLLENGQPLPNEKQLEPQKLEKLDYNKLQEVTSEKKVGVEKSSVLNQSDIIINIDDRKLGK